MSKPFSIIAILCLIALLGFSPSLERVVKFLPAVQVIAFTIVAINNGLQIASWTKPEKQ